jgi:hypothetical protein
MTIALPRALHVGDTGTDVTAVKRALVKWHHGDRDGVVINPHLGGKAEQLLERFQHAKKLAVDGVYGPATHRRLAPYFDDYGIAMLKQEAELLEQQATRPRNKFLQIADLSVQHQAAFRYTMEIGSDPGERGWFRASPLDWKPTKTCDCSQHYIGCGHHAGLDGVFDSDGATGALLGLEHIGLDDAQPGDGAIFVGPSHPEGVHISILRARMNDGNWRVINMGGSGQPAYRTLWAEKAYHARIGAGTVVVVRLPA